MLDELNETKYEILKEQWRKASKKRYESILIFFEDPTAGYIDFFPVNLDIFIQSIEDNCKNN